ncbi:MAG: hypothetical protein COB02_12350 [Candidatus Cloacimonadota bacterium]|nr:MAG: hypothetical protein COB02_12350 [Candidatus Cloacimonadota bacterium]
MMNIILETALITMSFFFKRTYQSEQKYIDLANRQDTQSKKLVKLLKDLDQENQKNISKLKKIKSDLSS